MIRMDTSIMPSRDAPLGLAFSGGVDSVAVLGFLVNGGRKPQLVVMDHGTETSKHSIELAFHYASIFSLSVLTGRITNDKPPYESLEEFWRNARYKFFHSIQFPVITAHHLNDAMETWIFTSINGNPNIIPIRNKNVIRPFIINLKEEFVKYVKQHDMQYYNDKSNENLSYNRNYIRHKVMAHVTRVNPGFAKVIRKKYLAMNNNFK